MLNNLLNLRMHGQLQEVLHLTMPPLLCASSGKDLPMAANNCRPFCSDPDPITPDAGRCMKTLKLLPWAASCHSQCDTCCYARPARVWCVLVFGWHLRPLPSLTNTQVSAKVVLGVGSQARACLLFSKRQRYFGSQLSLIIPHCQIVVSNLKRLQDTDTTWYNPKKQQDNNHNNHSW